jgi:hypothetical protein
MKSRRATRTLATAVSSSSPNHPRASLGTKVPPLPTSELIIDVFLSKYHLNLASPIRLSSSAESGSYQESTDGDREEDFVDVHEIHIDEDDHTELWWGDLA